MAFSPDSRHLAIAGDEQTITLLNARSGRRVKKIGSPPPAILSVAVSRTEPFVAAAASDGKVRLCDYQQRKIVAVSESMESPIVHTEFSPNGDILVAASQRGRVRVLNVHGLQTITEFQAHHDEFCGGALSACGQRFISVGYESKQREPWLFPAGVDTVDLSPTKMQPPQSAKSPWDRDARIVEWSLYDGRPLRQCDLPGEFRVRSVAASPARRKLAIASSKELAIADIQPADQRAINVHRMSHPEILEIAFVNNSQLLMGYEGYRIRRFDVQEKTPIGDLINPIFDDPTAFAFITGGSAFAVSSAYQSDILLFELATGSLQEVLMGHQNHVRALAVSPDERLLMSGGADGTLKLWDIRRGDLLASMIF